VCESVHLLNHQHSLIRLSIFLNCTFQCGHKSLLQALQAFFLSLIVQCLHIVILSGKSHYLKWLARVLAGKALATMLYIWGCPQIHNRHCCIQYTFQVKSHNVWLGSRTNFEVHIEHLGRIASISLYFHHRVRLNCHTLFGHTGYWNTNPLGKNWLNQCCFHVISTEKNQL
jgi:hypothetical protein